MKKQPKDKRPYVQMCFYLSEPLHEWLWKQSHEQNKSLALILNEVCRDARKISKAEVVEG